MKENVRYIVRMERRNPQNVCDKKREIGRVK